MNSTQVPNVTLQTAVLMQATEFANANQTFSVHDITRNLRTKVANGELEIPEVAVHGASFRFDISHARVKDIFAELWKTGMFDATFTLSRKYVNNYFECTPTLVAQPSAPQVASTQPVQVSTPSPTATPSTPALPQGIVTPQDIVSRVTQYLINCKARNFRPTLKHVQSAIKRGNASTGWSCSDLQVVIQKEGYTIVSDPQFLSASQIVTV